VPNDAGLQRHLFEQHQQAAFVGSVATGIHRQHIGQIDQGDRRHAVLRHHDAQVAERLFGSGATCGE